MKIISLDPGKTTGLVVGKLDEQEGKLRFKPGQAGYNHSGLYTFLNIESPDIIVYERFDYRNASKAGLELISVELIGIILLYAQYFKTGLYDQQAQLVGAGSSGQSKNKGYFNNKKFKELGYYRESSPHAMDALRHMLYWFDFGPGFRYNKQGHEKL